MKIVMVSNYYNHHQSPLANALYKRTNGQYHFIETVPMSQERKNLGWDDTVKEPFIKRSYNSQEEYDECIKIINDADVVIVGTAPEKLVRQRIKAGKLTFRYSERVYKTPKAKMQMPLRAIKYHWNNCFSKNVYLLCASAYASHDYALTGNFINKAFKWAYFTDVKKYDDVDSLIENKEPGSILWVARLIPLKHPELPIMVAKRLKEEGYDVKLNLVGNGVLEDNLSNLIKENGLEDCVKLLGQQSPDDVRKYMEQSKTFLFTSDFNEGWGAVVNEALNSACAVVSSHAAGASPYLIDDGKNGMLYRNGDFEDLYSKVKKLFDDQSLQNTYCKKAYENMCDLWNADIASQRFIDLCNDLLNGGKGDLFKNGPCSKAQILKNNWY